MESTRAAPPVTVKARVLLNTPFCRTCALPVVDPSATVAAICVSLQLVTVAVAVPSHTRPMPWLAPKFAPVIVTAVPTGPLEGVTSLTVATGIVNANAFDDRSGRRTCTVPELDPVGTVATICVSLQEKIEPGLVPSQRTLLF